LRVPALGGHNMTQAAALYTIQEVSNIIGIEESKIRFLELQFQEFFNWSTPDITGRYFNNHQVSLLQRINQLMLDQKLSVGQIRNELACVSAHHGKAVQLIAITSGKGGVGKTTVTVNLAIAAARLGHRTLVFDADLGLANVHILTGIKPRGTVMDVITGKCSIDEVLTDGPEKIKILCGSSGIAELADLNKDILQYLGKELRQLAMLFDVIIIDTAAGIANNVLHFLSISHDIVVVATPNVASILDAYGMIKVSRERQMSADIHLLINQVDNEKQAVTVYNNITTCSRRFLDFNPNYLGFLRSDPSVEKSYQDRNPLLLSYPYSVNSKLFTILSKKLFGKKTPDPRNRVMEKKLSTFLFGKDFQPVYVK
jgi:flagellar biosynthesis protein FlhG